MIRGTRFMPPLKNFEDAILLLETSENVPSPGIVEVMFRNPGLAGVIDKVNGIAFSRFRGYTMEMRDKVHSAIQRVLEVEFRQEKIPAVTGVDFGHTDPYFHKPVGIRADIRGERIRLLESLTV